jgi:hypothetical protein
VALLHVFLYSLAQLQLLISFLKNKHKQPKKVAYQKWPNVTIQLPLYNEAYVVKRLIDNMVTIDYPQDCLEIQVLDDSTDSSKELNQELVTKYQNLGINIKHITRLNRDGFKAGALKEGLKQASGEFIAVFDADFLPKSNWLKNTLPYFSSPDIGVVQTRWGHLNRNQNLLTKIQAFALDFHFTVEQVGRNLQQHFINFNGTAGIWRKECIYNAGNWHGDTLTEDLDLSYRAQLKGWKFVYLKNIVTPAELPLFISAARSQQFRWNKGAAENFRKNYVQVLKSSDLKISSKFHSFFHLLNSSMFFMVLMLALLSIPLLFIKHHNPNLIHLFYVLSGLGSSTLFFLLAYWYSFIEVNGKSFRGFFKFLGLFLVFFSVAMGLSLHNSVAVLEGHFKKKSGFIRTPKFNTRITENKYVAKHLNWINLLEVILLIYFAYGVYAAFVVQDFGLISFHLMLCFGFGFVAYNSICSKV